MLSLTRGYFITIYTIMRINGCATGVSTISRLIILRYVTFTRLTRTSRRDRGALFSIKRKFSSTRFVRAGSSNFFLSSLPDSPFLVSAFCLVSFSSRMCEDDFLPFFEKLLANRPRPDGSISESSREDQSFSRFVPNVPNARPLLSRHFECQMTFTFFHSGGKYTLHEHRRRRFTFRWQFN